MVMANRDICLFSDALGDVDGHVCCDCEDEVAVDAKQMRVELISDGHSNVLLGDPHCHWTVAAMTS
jgi:hypothetical protein